MRPGSGLFVLLLALHWRVTTQNAWNNVDQNKDPLEFVGDPSPGLKQRRCYHYYGHTATRNGKEWATTACNDPFDHVCLLIKGEAELEDYVFATSFVRGCHFRCPCPESQPWEQWYKGATDNWMRDPSVNHALDTAGVTNRRWEKKCFMQTPPKAYAITSRAMTFSMHKPIYVRCCKKHWDWIGHANDTKKHPRHPQDIRLVNRSVDVRVGWWGNEYPKAQPPIMLDPEEVTWGAEDCNDWPDEDPMTPWTATAFYDTTIANGWAPRNVQLGWLSVLLIVGSVLATIRQ